MPHNKNIVAVLGPTNTGKTRYAIEQMLAHKSGMIGLPLRLLAREVFDTVSAKIGGATVALITGEEKIIPADPRYWICTTEAMPSDLAVEFLAVDEIQLCADRERGHIFTDRLLHRRGTSQTMFLGSDTMRHLIADLVPSTRFETRSRLSKLTWAGQKKLSRLPARTAIVAFSAETVYSLAELIRRQRGGAAVIMGNLSPRTRNAQVGLYQSGEVNFLVATDAIGMGLNMDINHVAFAALRKFDGQNHRHLSLAELGQIAGRAGRYLNDGTFGVTANATPLEIDEIERLEDHDFDLLRQLQWRNKNLNFTSIGHLIASLKAQPNREGLVRSRNAADIQALEILSRDVEISDMATTRDDVERLWTVCQLPDYRNISANDHASLISRIFSDLSKPAGCIDEDWFARQLSYCDKAAGDIDTISNRISHIRTWTFVANRPEWIADPLHWQARARDIEDKLSDALHEALTARFIDQRTSRLMARLRQRKEFMSTVQEDGSVLVEEQKVGTLTGLKFVSDIDEASAAPELKAAATKAVTDELAARAMSLVAIPDQELKLSAAGAVIWQGAEIATLQAGDKMLKPVLQLMSDELLDETNRQAVMFRLQKFIQRQVSTILEPLQNLQDDEAITGLARGVAFQISENLGVVERSQVAKDVKALDQEARGSLRKHQIRFGAFHIFIPLLLKPAATQLRLLLWSLHQEKENNLDRSKLPEPPGQGLTSSPVIEGTPDGFYRIAGYKVCGNRVVRIDMLERLGDMIRTRVFWRQINEKDERPEGSVEGGGFTVIADMMSLVGCSGEEFSAILTALGFKAEKRPLPATPAKEPAPTPDPANSQADATPENSDPKEKEPQLAPDEKPAEPAQPSGDNQSGEQEKEASEETEPGILEVWWPKDTGPFRRQKPSAPRPKHHKKNQNRKQAQSRPKNKKPPVKTINPEDSPFAALAALKKNLKK